jgi:hypothetical protein
MTAETATTTRTKVTIWLLAGLGLLTFVGANSHLVYVASISQPDCVEHLRETGGSSGQFRAATSSCTHANQALKATAEAERR